jgi:membrane protease YdiL (CAAX protease family)
MVRTPMSLPTSVRHAVARHPVTAFLIIGNGVYLAAALTPALVESEILPFDLPLWGSLGGILGVGLAAFLVSAATEGRAGVTDLLHRTVRWRVPLRWYLIALLGVPLAATLVAIMIYGMAALAPPAGGWPRAIGEVLLLFVLQLILFQLAEEIGWTGFLQDRWQDRYHPLKLSAMVAFPWAVWHLPDFFVEEGWTIEQLAPALVFLVVEFVSLFFARVLIVWLYDRTRRSVFLVAGFHASFDAAISELSIDIVPASNTERFLILTGVIILGATAVIATTRGRITRCGVGVVQTLVAPRRDSPPGRGGEPG